MAGFSSETWLIWVKQRNVAKRVAQWDRDHGGAPTLQEFEAYMCPSCERWNLGLDARDLANRVETARVAVASGADPGQVLCGVHCQAAGEIVR
jgi:hypothetical protein